MPCPAAGLRQIDTAEKQHEFFLAEGDFVAFFVRFRPPKASLLQAFGAYPEAAAIPEQQFQPIALRVAKHKDVPAQRIARQPVAHQSEESFKSLAHVRRSGGKINARGRPDAEHDQASSTAMSCRNVPASNPGFTSTRSPLDRSTVSSPPPQQRGWTTSTATNLWDLCGSLPSAFCFR